MTDRAEQLRKGKAAERARKRAAGLVKIEIWAPPHVVDEIKMFAEAQAEHYGIAVSAATARRRKVIQDILDAGGGLTQRETSA